jgi:streptogrisin C
LGNAGNYSGVLASPAGTQFGLALERKKGNRWWQVAATSTPNTRVSYDGNAGTYRWRVIGLNGSGAYALCSITP